MMKSLSALGMIAAATLFCAAPLSLHWSPAKSLSLSVDTADARVGRPLTPMSRMGKRETARLKGAPKLGGSVAVIFCRRTTGIWNYQVPRWVNKRHPRRSPTDLA